MLLDVRHVLNVPAVFAAFKTLYAGEADIAAIAVGGLSGRVDIENG